MKTPEQLFGEWWNESEQERRSLKQVVDYARSAFLAGISAVSQTKPDPFVAAVEQEIEEHGNYNHRSHTHCWAQKQPSACSIPIDKHTQCCLCDMKPPTKVTTLKDVITEEMKDPEFKKAWDALDSDPEFQRELHGTDTQEGWESGLDALVRDFTAVGSMSKSEARRRFNELLLTQKVIVLEQAFNILHKHAMETKTTEALDAIEAAQKEIVEAIKRV